MSTVTGIEWTEQWGGPAPKAGGRLLDGRTWSQMPPAAAEKEAGR